MRKNNNLLTLIGTSLVLTGCFNYHDSVKDETIMTLKEEDKLRMHYLEANTGQIASEEMKFMQQYKPVNATPQESLMIKLLYHHVGSKPLTPYNSELTTEQRWNSLEVEKKLAFYHRLKEIHFSKQ